ncbi:MAG: ABC transporter permease [Nitrospira sp.]|jgi:putative ABC transport system permease protein|uniref:ABC transporter permease n=1 Tax=Nitrospira sp. ND1 TaxID=1658518 RepID=UPI0009B9C210|nr:ABC transporter permease [Nitrospira sp. ND1]MBK7417962.1 ABC transporter permease [Nitrospira sp.]MBK9112347.1 ABC transporter permease [Nitrospira sp.]MBK9995892.1 ABC transporter permease [Nitrospira sp.]MBP6200798.1 ABC transporter permease [Nitrospira sp.]MBP6204463.1 ABC transporter permease [Nitrospira sp.]
MSFLWLTIQSALRVLRRNPLRAGLTMLGIVIGVGAVVGMVSLGQGATASVQREIASLGTNVLIIIPGATTTGGVRGGLGSVSTLTVDDARDIEKRIGDISLVTYASRSVLQVVHEHKNWNTIALGTTTAFPDLRNWPVADGNFFTQADEDAAAKVVVLGKTVADNLFERGEEVIGAQIRVKNVPLRVIGILSSKGQSLSGQDQDDIVVLPFTTAERKVLGTKFLGTVGIIMVATQHRYSIPAAVEEIKELLRARHRIHPAEENDFTIRTMEDVAKTVAGASRTMMVMLLSIASISLVVGGIGIMNILLVSVTERTREIGIRMAVGAKRAHILLQFLVEAIILTAIGGVAGVIFGIAGARLLTRLIGWPTIISSQAVAVAFLFSLAVGIFFGLYPANKASRMNPIDALHYE